MPLIDKSLIERADRAISAYARTGSMLDAIEILHEIVESAKRFGAVADREGEIWFEHAKHWCLVENCATPELVPSDVPHTRSHGRTLEYVDEHYGPIRHVDRDDT